MSLPNPAELISQMATSLTAHLQHRAISEPRFVFCEFPLYQISEALGAISDSSRLRAYLLSVRMWMGFCAAPVR